MLVLALDSPGEKFGFLFLAYTDCPLLAKLRVPNLLPPHNFINHEVAFVSNKRDVRRAVVNKHRPKE